MASPTSTPDRHPVSPAARLARLVLLAVVLYLGWEVFSAYRAMLLGPGKNGEPLDLPFDVPLSPAEMLVAAPGDGPWTFAGVPLKLTGRQVPAADLTQQLEKPLAVENGAAPMFLPTGLKTTLANMKFEKKGRGVDTVYVLKRTDLAIVLFVRQGQEGRWQLLGGRIAAPGQNGSWQVLEAAPSSDLPGVPVSGHEGLLPLPPIWKPVARRQDDHGRLVSEIGQAPGPAGDLEAMWRQAGWQIRPVARVERGTFLVCLKGEATIGAWMLPGPLPNDPGLLILVRASKK